MTIIALWLFLMVPWAGLQCVIVVFPGHTHFFFILITEVWAMKPNKLPLVLKGGVKNAKRTVSQFRFWYLVLPIELATLSLIRAFREANFVLHCQAVSTYSIFLHQQQY